MIPLSHLDPSLERLAKKIEQSKKDYVLFAINEAYALLWIGYLIKPKQ